MDIKNTLEKITSKEEGSEQLNFNEFNETQYNEFVSGFLAESYENRLEYLKLIVDAVDLKFFENKESNFSKFIQLEENKTILESDAMVDVA